MSYVGEQAKGALGGAAIHEQWVSLYRTPEAQGFYEEAFDAIVKDLNAPDGAVILDAGCGSCAKSVLLAARGLRVVATDFSASALELAKGTLKAHNVQDRISLRQADLTNLPFAEGEFHYILCWGVLMHVPELERAMSELARVLARGGVLVLSEGNLHSAQSVAIRAVRRALGKGRGRIVRVTAGAESHEQTPNGPLVTRQIDAAAYARLWQRLGLRLKERRAGQFTELYTLARWKWLRRAIHAWNHVWFRYVRLAGPAYGNILMFEKRA